VTRLPGRLKDWAPEGEFWKRLRPSLSLALGAEKKPRTRNGCRVEAVIARPHARHKHAAMTMSMSSDRALCQGLRAGNEITFTTSGRSSAPWRDGVVPLAVEIMGTQSDSLHLLLRDLDLGRVAPCIQTGLDLQARRRRRRGDQLDNDLVAHQRPTTPVHRDVREQPMLDLVPLTRARREVADGNLQARLVGEPLQFHLPEFGDTIPNCLGELGEIGEGTGIAADGHPAGAPGHWR